MTITLEIQPEIERGLLARAEARGISITAFVEEIVAREAQTEAAAESEPKNLVELFANSPFKRLNMEFERDRDYGREISL